MKYIKVSPVERHKTFKKYLAHDFNDKDYKLVNEDTTIFDENNEILAILIKNKITDHEYLLDLYKTFRNDMNTIYSNRGASAGLIDRSKIKVPNNVRHLVKIEKNAWRFQYIGKNGLPTKRNLSNPSRSRIIGYTDSQDIQKFSNGNEDFIIRAKKSKISRTNKNWTIVYKLVHLIEEEFKKRLPVEFDRQKKCSEKIKSYCIDNSIYSTITINNNFKTYLHTDDNNFDNGYGCLMIDEQNGIRHNGFNLLFPRYELSIDMKKGDILFFKSKEYHCNTHYEATENYERTSYVFYLRKKLLDVLDLKHSTLTLMNEVDNYDYLSKISKGLEKYDKTKEQKNFYFSKNLKGDSEEKKILLNLPKKAQIIIDCDTDFTDRELKRITYKRYKMNFINKVLQQEYYKKYRKISHYCF